MKAKVLVTGAGGYIGSLLCPKLVEAGYFVLALDTSSVISRSGFCDEAISLISGDTADPSFMKELIPQADVIIPLAALVGAPVCDKKPELAKRVNLESIELLNKIRSRNQLVIFPMTNNGYVLAPGEEYADETATFKTDSLYTRTKFHAEQELLGTGNVISLRLASLFGVSPATRWDLLLHYYISEAVSKKKLSIFEANFKRSFVHVKDAADCFIYGITNAATMKDQIFNLASPAANISKLDLALKIKKFIPDFLIESDTKTQDPDARNVYISVQKLKAAGFEAKRTLDEGIQELLEFCRSQPLKMADAS